MNGITHGDTILSSLHKTLELSLKYGEADDADIEKFKEMAKTVCKIEHTSLLGHDIVKEAAKQVTVEDFDQFLDEHRKEPPKFKPQNSKRFMDFVKKAQRMVDVEQGETSQNSQNLDTSMETDSQTSSQLIPDIDPITKTQLQHPVRNKHCNHIYGYDSVLQLVQRNPRLRCPIVGCPNKQFVQMTDLIEDEELALRLARQRKQQDRQ